MKTLELDQLRKQLHLNQDELAKYLGMSRSTVSRLERKKTSPNNYDAELLELLQVYPKKQWPWLRRTIQKLSHSEILVRVHMARQIHTRKK